MNGSPEGDSPPFTPPSSPTRPNGSAFTSPVPFPSAGGFRPATSPFLIGVAGGTASGKTSVCERIMEQLGQVDSSQKRVVMLSQDSFYKKLDSKEKKLANKGEYNFDHPDAFDTKLLSVTLKAILESKPVQVPKYDFKTHSRDPDMVTIFPADVVLLEGILVLYDPQIRELMHMKLFVDTDSDTRLARRVLRDTQEMGRDLDQVLNQYINFVKPAFEEFTLPTKKYADVIIPRGAENNVAIDLIVQHIKDILAGNIDITKRKAFSRNRRTRRQSDSLLARPH